MAACEASSNQIAGWALAGDSTAIPAHGRKWVADHYIAGSNRLLHNCIHVCLFVYVQCYLGREMLDGLFMIVIATEYVTTEVVLHAMIYCLTMRSTGLNSQ